MKPSQFRSKSFTTALARSLTLLSFFNFAGANNGYTYWMSVSAGIATPPARPIYATLDHALNPIQWQSDIVPIISKIRFECNGYLRATLGQMRNLLAGLSDPIALKNFAFIIDLHGANKERGAGILTEKNPSALYKELWVKPEKLDIWSKKRALTKLPAFYNLASSSRIRLTRTDWKVAVFVWRAAPAVVLWQFLLVRSRGGESADADSTIEPLMEVRLKISPVNIGLILFCAHFSTMYSRNTAGRPRLFRGQL